jgi:phosphohistidine phosphatase
MAQQLWLLRHGDAEPHGVRHDADRRLTEKGERQARMAGKALAKLGVQFVAVYTSPRVRAKDTARLAAEELGGADPLVHQPLSAGFDVDEALSLLAGYGEDARLLLVGHEPDFSQVVYDLTGGRIDLKKGGIATVRVDGRQGEQIDLLRPKEIEEIAS